MKILALETTRKKSGICLWEDFKVRAVKVENDTRSYSNRLMLNLNDIFKKVPWKAQDLDAIAVNVGPGKFTGLRLGVSAARTLGQILQKPVLEVTSLEALAAQGSGWQIGKPFVWKFSQDLLCVLTDALRGEVFMAVWRFHKLTERTRRSMPSGKTYHTFGHHFKLVHSLTLFPFDRFLSFFQSCFQVQSFLFVGSAAYQYQAELKKAFGRRARFLPNIAEPDARWVAAVGSEKFFRREFKSYNQLKPLYMRPSYAEETALKGKG